MLIRDGKTIHTAARVRVLLRATDTMREYIQDPGASNHTDIAEIMAAVAVT